jgi:outer membrane protein assembly factor BamB
MARRSRQLAFPLFCLTAICFCSSDIPARAADGADAPKGQAEKLDDLLEAALRLPYALDDDDMIVPQDDGERRISPAGVARARISRILATADEKQRSRLEKQIEAACEKERDDVWRLRGVVRLLDPATEVGAKAHLDLAKRLMKVASPIQIETVLLPVMARANADYAKQATELLGGLMLMTGHPEDAVHWLMPSLEGPVWGPSGRLDGKVERGNYQQEFPRLCAHVEGERLPLLVRRHLYLDPENGDLLLAESSDKPANLRTLLHHKSLLEAIPKNLTRSWPDAHCYSQGHLLIFTFASTVAAVDAIEEHLLWQYYLPNPSGHMVAIEKPTTDEDGAFRLSYDNGWTQRLDHNVLVQAGYVCFLDRNGLTCVDPVSGKVCWTRRDVKPRSMLIGDAEYILQVELDEKCRADRIRCFRAVDGSRLELGEVAKNDQDRYGAFDGRLKLLGRNVLVQRRDEKQNEVLALYDLLAGKTLWTATFPEKSRMLHAEDPALTGMVTREGNVRVLATKDGSRLLEGVLDPKYMHEKAQLSLLRDRELWYVLINDDPANAAVPNVSAESGIRTVPVNGQVYSYDPKTYKMRWRVEVKESAMILQDWQDLPFIVFTSRYKSPQKRAINSYGGNFTMTRAVEKKNGKLIYDEVDALNGPRFYSLNVDWSKQQAELVGDSAKVIIKVGEP